MLDESTVVHGSQPDLLAAFLTRLAIDHFGAPVDGPWFDRAHPMNK